MYRPLRGREIRDAHMSVRTRTGYDRTSGTLETEQKGFEGICCGSSRIDGRRQYFRDDERTTPIDDGDGFHVYFDHCHIFVYPPMV